VSIRLGYQIPNFTYPGTVSDIFPTVVAQAREAEQAGFDTVLLMDHFYQLPGIGTPDDPMLEAYTTLGALAASTTSIQLSALVTGNTYRNPAHLAKIVTTLDVLSGGRAVLALGAGWFELEHQELGFEFGTFTERFERLGEALQVIEPMLRGRRPELSGQWYQAHGTRNSPQLRTDVPILIGGSGEKKTFRLAAEHADHLNIIAAASQLPQKLHALAERCAEAGRDRDTLETSFLAQVFMDADGDRARTLHEEHLRRTGTDSDAMRAAQGDRYFVGTPDDVAEQLRAKVLDAGIQGLIVNMVANGHEPGAVEMAAKALRPLVS
jgi:F420-dependent oxidoreductase-like protein